MNTPNKGAVELQTKRLTLFAQTREEVRAQIENLSPQDRKEVSPVWLARLDASASMDPWIHGFRIMDRASGAPVGFCGFKGPPDSAGVVEIAYGVAPEHQNKGYATEAAAALVDFALGSVQVRVVRAHTLPRPSASTRVLTKCGFRYLGEAIDPEDGLVWRWDFSRSG
jgi:RimJ/RimL family protein N-acetyltransferase